MAAVQQHHHDFWARVWKGLNDLEFVTNSFTWLFRLMNRLAEPMMTLSAIYIIIEAGVPLVSVPVLHWLSVALLISAPEIILPGAFILSGELHEAKNPRWRWLFIMCWIFVGLTALTLADLFVFHLSGVWFEGLMWMRCAASFGYSILFRVITHKPFAADVPTSPQSVPAIDFAAKFDEVQAMFERQLQGIATKIAEEKPTPIVAEKRPNYEQVRWSESPVVWQQNTFVFMEYGQLLKEQNSEEDSQKSEEHSSENFQEEEQEESASQGGSRGKYTMTFEEASQYTGYSISTLKTQLSEGKIKQSLSGKLLVKSLKIKPGYSGNVSTLQLVK